MYSIVYTKKAAADIANLKAAKLDAKAKALIEILKINMKDFRMFFLVFSE